MVTLKKYGRRPILWIRLGPFLSVESFSQRSPEPFSIVTSHV